MSDLNLIFSSLKSRWLSSILSIFLTAFGVMLALIIIQFGHHIHDRISADGKGIDIVVGAKGSPLQLILSSVYHIDIPTGNIPYKDAEKWMKHRHVKSAIPLALGDNWKSHRIVGTTVDYIDHYGASINTGRIWKQPFEALAGADVPLLPGDTFKGAHGLIEGGHQHDNETYKIVGTVEKTGTVLDRLILTSLDSVLEIHGIKGIEGAHDHNAHEAQGHDDHHTHHNHQEHEHHEEHGHEAHAPHTEETHASEAEITALLLTTKTPIANINIPRSINRETSLQAANPAIEMARLTAMLGLGTKSFTVLSTLFIIISALSIFAGLAGTLENRMGDLAILRAIGYSKRRIFKIITLEGMAIAISGITIGLVIGIYGFLALRNIITPLGASGAKLAITPDFILVLLAAALAGLIASALPAMRAMRVDVAKQLSNNA